MRFATLISWLLTASLGAYMLRTWVARGGPRRERARKGGLPPQMIFGHATLALTGLVIWCCFLATSVKALAWVAILLLMVAVGFGLSTVTLWTPYPVLSSGDGRKPEERGDAGPVVVPDAAGAAPPRDAGAAAPPRDAGAAAEYHITDEMIAQLLADPHPRGRPSTRPHLALLVPVAHGFLAMATFMLAVMTASLA